MMQFLLKANLNRVLNKLIELNLITHLRKFSKEYIKVKALHTHIKTNIIQVNAINKTCLTRVRR
jgi:hypothetical protein